MASPSGGYNPNVSLLPNVGGTITPMSGGGGGIAMGSESVTLLPQVNPVPIHAFHGGYSQFQGGVAPVMSVPVPSVPVPSVQSVPVQSIPQGSNMMSFHAPHMMVPMMASAVASSFDTFPMSPAPIPVTVTYVAG